LSIALAYQHILHQADELEALIEGCSRNERGAQNKLYELFYPKMMALVRRYFPEEFAAEEILNNGFLRAFQKIDKYSFRGSFEGWLRQIFRHAVADYVKKNLSYKTQIVLAEKEEMVRKDSVANLYYEDLMKLVQSLPETARIVFNMFAIDGLSHKEISDLLNIKEGTSKWYVAEARKELKIKIEALELHFKK
jgi:RNA polymerase sigma-70 factor (ECF subfamily)